MAKDGFLDDLHMGIESIEMIEDITRYRRRDGKLHRVTCGRFVTSERMVARWYFVLCPACLDWKKEGWLPSR